MQKVFTVIEMYIRTHTNIDVYTYIYVATAEKLMGQAHTKDCRIIREYGSVESRKGGGQSTCKAMRNVVGEV